jgi:hypothetical protein
MAHFDDLPGFYGRPPEQKEVSDKSNLIDFNDTEYEQFCTPRQLEALLAYRKGGTLDAAAWLMGISRYGIRKHMLLIEKKAVKQGYSPKHHINRIVPEPLELTGLSDMQVNEHGKPIWYKFNKSQIQQAKRVMMGVDAYMQDLPRYEPSDYIEADYDTDIIPWFNIGDAHIGMLAHDAEVGHNFDLKIAERELTAALYLLIDRVPKTERCVIQDLGGATHYDNIVGKTANSGHDLDYDTRLPKMIDVYTRTFRRIIEMALKKFKYVDFICNQGNHSEVNDHWMGVFLNNVYENEPRLTVIDNRCVFIPYRMGNTFVMCHHTHKCKPTALAGVMANDFAHDWGETTYHYIDGGHIHHNMVTKELNGAKFESFNQLAPADKYAHDGGWRSRSLLTCVLRSKTYGEKGRITLTAEEVKDRIMKLKPGTTAKVRRKVHTV